MVGFRDLYPQCELRMIAHCQAHVGNIVVSDVELFQRFDAADRGSVLSSRSCLFFFFSKKKKSRQHLDHTSQNGNINSRSPLRVLLLFCATPLHGIVQISLAFAVDGAELAILVFLWHSSFALLVSRGRCGRLVRHQRGCCNRGMILRFAPRLPRRSCNFELSIRNARQHGLSALTIQSETSETLDAQENAQISATLPQAFVFTNCTIHKEDADALTQVLGEVLKEHTANWRVSR